MTPFPGQVSFQKLPRTSVEKLIDVLCLILERGEVPQQNQLPQMHNDGLWLANSDADEPTDIDDIVAAVCQAELQGGGARPSAFRPSVAMPPPVDMPSRVVLPKSVISGPWDRFVRFGDRDFTQVMNTVDNLTATMADPGAVDSVKAALKGTIDQLLQQNGLQRFEPKVGAGYNPLVCNAVSSEYAGYQAGVNTILRILRAGYKSGNKLIRQADVVVSRIAATDDERKPFNEKQRADEKARADKMWEGTAPVDPPIPGARGVEGIPDPVPQF